MIKIQPPEKERTYKFPSGDSISFFCVSAIKVSDSGNHRLETEDGLKHIVSSGWLSISIEVDKWTI